MTANASKIKKKKKGLEVDVAVDAGSSPLPKLADPASSEVYQCAKASFGGEYLTSKYL